MLDWNEMIKLAKELKQMAMEKNIPIIMAQQHPPLHRSTGVKVNRKPDIVIIDYMDVGPRRRT